MPCCFVYYRTKISLGIFVTVVVKHRMQTKLIFDHNLHFTIYFWHELILVLSCEHALSTAYHLQTDGQTKCMHYSVE